MNNNYLHHRTYAVLAVLAVLGIAAPASATVIMDATTLNGSFESPGGNFPVPTGWTASSGSASTINTGGYPTPLPNGTSFNFNQGQATGFNGVWQNTGVAFAANTNYTLTGYVAKLGSAGHTWDGSGLMDLRYGAAAANISNAANFAANTFALATTDDFSIASQPTDATAWTQWMPWSTSYTTGATGPEIGQNIFVFVGKYYAVGPGGQGHQVSFDNLVLTATAVPEPSAFAVWLIGLSALALLAVRMRRSAAQRCLATWPLR